MKILVRQTCLRFFLYPTTTETEKVVVSERTGRTHARTQPRKDKEVTDKNKTILLQSRQNRAFFLYEYDAYAYAHKCVEAPVFKYKYYYTTFHGEK